MFQFFLIFATLQDRPALQKKISKATTDLSTNGIPSAALAAVLETLKPAALSPDLPDKPPLQEVEEPEDQKVQVMLCRASIVFHDQP